MAVMALLLLGGLFMLGCRPNNPATTIASPSPVITSIPQEPRTTITTPLPTLTIASILAASPTPSFTPLTAQSIDCTYGGEFKSMEALDEFTIRFTLCKPDVAFLSKIAFPTFGIHPREWLEQAIGKGDDNSWLEKPIGSGPYQVEEWRDGQEIIFRLFEDYWGAEARTPNLVFRWNIDSAQSLVELQAGTIQGMDNPNPADFSLIEADPNLTLYPRLALNVLYVGMNNTIPPFNDERVRMAMALALDRQKIIQDNFPTGYEVASHFAPCVIPNGCAGEAWYEYDPVRAKELLSEAGYPNGFETELVYRDLVFGYLPKPTWVVEEIKDQLSKNLGVKLIVRVLASQDFIRAIDSGSLPGLYLMGWGADYPDISNFLDTHFGSQAGPQFGNKFADILEALAAGSRFTSNDVRLPFYEAANNAIRQHIPMIPISHGGWVTPDGLATAFSRAAVGAYASPFGFENFAGIGLPGEETLVWMQDAEPFSLYCADETDIDTLRACGQITETLYRYGFDGSAVEPALAQECTPDENLSVWTCRLRKGVRFHDGSLLDANDVLMSFWVQWDAAHPLHKGRTGSFAYFRDFWGNFLNALKP
jgi:peptide/nickel transport system substrate-binding protein